LTILSFFTITYIPMAYIYIDGKTTTLRAQFSSMPPMTHDPNPEDSDVLAHIMETMDVPMEVAQKAFNSMRNPSSRVLIYDRVHAVWHGCEWLPDTEKDADLMMNRKLGEIKKDIQRDKTWTRKREKEIKKLNEDMDEIYARVDAINATMAELNNLLPNLEKAIAEIRQEVKAISDLKAEVGSKYRFLIGSDELQDERLAVLEKRLGIDYLAGTPADSTQPS
jgi:DNA repair ATPase RecN